jgi:hypothetical protein
MTEEYGEPPTDSRASAWRRFLRLFPGLGTPLSLPFRSNLMIFFGRVRAVGEHEETGFLAEVAVTSALVHDSVPKAATQQSEFLKVIGYGVAASDRAPGIVSQILPRNREAASLSRLSVSSRMNCSRFSCGVRCGSAHQMHQLNRNRLVIKSG